MALFEKKVKVYEAKGKKAEWKQVRKALKDAGITKISADIWQDEIGPGGCGAHLDARDFGPNGKIDRDIYAVRVPESQREKAEEVVHSLLPSYVPYAPDPNRARLV